MRPVTAASLCVCLALLAIAPYAQIANHDFVHYDDDVYVVENPHVAQGLDWDGVRWAFTTSHAGNWHPLTWLSHMLDAEIHGLDPAGHHATNVALHALDSILLWLALALLTQAPLPSWLVAALFAVHPLGVESVAWVAQRKNLLAALLWMLALIAYAGYVRQPGALRYALVCLALALGLLAKPTLVTLPLVLLLLDFWPLARWRPDAASVRGLLPPRRLVLEKLPLLALAAVSSAVTFAVQSAGGAVGSLERLPFTIRFANAAVAYVLYLGKAAWPLDLAVFYPHPATLPSFSAPRFAVAAVAAGSALAAVTVVVGRAWRRRPYLLAGWLWYLGTLVPVIGVVQVGMQSLADRYAYLPLIGVHWMVVWGAAELAAQRPRLRTPLGVAAALLLAAWTAATWIQARVWRDDRTLFEHAVRVTRDNFVAHGNLGNAYARAGDLERAAREIEAGIRSKPDYAKAHNNLGVVRERRRDFAGAIRAYERATELDPGYAVAYRNLGNARQLAGDLRGAATAYGSAVATDPTFADAHAQLGGVHAQLGALDAARANLEQSLALEPGDAAVRNNLGFVLRESGDLAGAETQILEALRLQPAYPDALNNLGIVYVRQGRLQRAAEQFTRALALDPANAAAREYLRRASAADAGD